MSASAGPPAGPRRKRGGRGGPGRPPLWCRNPAPSAPPASGPAPPLPEVPAWIPRNAPPSAPILGSIGLGGALVALLCAGRSPASARSCGPACWRPSVPWGTQPRRRLHRLGSPPRRARAHRGAPGGLVHLGPGGPRSAPRCSGAPDPDPRGAMGRDAAGDGGRLGAQGPWRNGSRSCRRSPTGTTPSGSRWTRPGSSGGPPAALRAGAGPPAHRPALYEPGQTVRFRGLLVRAADLVPLGERPGVFEVLDPDGLVVFQERAITDALGVAHSDFPDPGASAPGRCGCAPVIWWSIKPSRSALHPAPLHRRGRRRAPGTSRGGADGGGRGPLPRALRCRARWWRCPGG